MGGGGLVKKGRKSKGIVEREESKSRFFFLSFYLDLYGCLPRDPLLYVETCFKLRILNMIFKSGLPL